MKPVIYQILPRLYTNVNPACIPGGTIEQNGVGKFNDFTPELLASLRDLGATHLWFTGVIEHATATDYSAHGIARDNPRIVKGKAGSPYAIKDYYDVDPDLAVDVDRRMEEFEALVARAHDAGLKMIIDFVPNHVARQYRSDRRPRGVDDLGAHDDPSLFFGHDNNFYYITRQLFAPSIPVPEGADPYVEFPAKASGNDCFTAFPGPNDWYETVKLNYGVDYGDGSRHFDPVPDTWFKMLHILRFWGARGVDGFRCDMAHMVPLEFWEWAIPSVKRHFPHIVFIAEIYDVALYRDFIRRGAFDYLYDKVNLYDTLRGIVTSNLSAAQLTGCWQTVEGIGRNMLNFLENHDEQRFGSPQFAGNPAIAAPALVTAAFISTGPLMVYMGQELGEQALDAEGFSGRDGRTTIFDYWSMPSTRRWLASGKPDDTALSDGQRRLRRLYATVMRLCNSEKAIAEGGFFDLMYVNYTNPTLNPHRHYVFLRHHGTAVVLVAVNFAAEDADLAVNLPLHAFETLGVNPAAKPLAATDLLTGTREPKDFAPDRPFRTRVPAYGAVAWKLSAKAPTKAAAKVARSRKNA